MIKRSKSESRKVTPARSRHGNSEDAQGVEDASIDWSWNPNFQVGSDSSESKDGLLLLLCSEVIEAVPKTLRRDPWTLL